MAESAPPTASSDTAAAAAAYPAKDPAPIAAASPLPISASYVGAAASVAPPLPPEAPAHPPAHLPPPPLPHPKAAQLPPRPLPSPHRRWGAALRQQLEPSPGVPPSNTASVLKRRKLERSADSWRADSWLFEEYNRQQRAAAEEKVAARKRAAESLGDHSLGLGLSRAVADLHHSKAAAEAAVQAAAAVAVGTGATHRSSDGYGTIVGRTNGGVGFSSAVNCRTSRQHSSGAEAAHRLRYTQPALQAESPPELVLAARHRWPPDSAIPTAPPPAGAAAQGAHLLHPPSPLLAGDGAQQQHAAALQAEREAQAALDLHQQARSEARRRFLSMLTAGGVAGAISRTATAPVDRLKMIMQVNDQAGARLTLRKAFRTMAAEGSVRAFFRGNGANVVKIAPETALKLTINDSMKALIVRDKHHIRPHELLMAGALAGASAQAIIYPLELIRTRLAVSPVGHYRGIAHCVQLVLAQEGWRAFYRGMLPSMIGILPYAGVDIATFEILKQRLLEEHGGRPPPPAIFAAGMLSSCVAQFVSYPLALVRTRLQAQGVGGAKLKYTGMWDVVSKTVRKEGFFGLYKGVLPNLFKLAPAAGISWFTFEEVKRLLGVDVNS